MLLLASHILHAFEGLPITLLRRALVRYLISERRVHQVGDEGGLALLRSPSFQKGGGLPAAAGDSPRGPPRDPRIPPSGPNLAGNPEAIQAKSVSLRDNVPVSRAQLLGGLGTAGRSDSAKTRPSLSLKDLSDDVREKLAASQAAAAAGGSNNSEGVQGRQPLTGKSGSAKAERSFSF